MKFYSKAVSEHEEVPLADEGRFERLVEQWDAKSPNHAPFPHSQETSNRCFLLSIHDTADPCVQLARANELLGLVQAQGDLVVGSEQLLLRKKDARTFLGAGVAERAAAAARAAGANMLVLDAELSPSQARNLEDATGLPICDREAVILNVFRRHASTKRARLQVEIAQLEYLRPRIRGIGLNMDQQMGGSNKARGPGETASELLSRRIDKRIADLRRGLIQLKQSDSAQRKQRRGAFRVALVGYTNAGKTSLMNALTNAALSVRNRPFETLDTTSRAIDRHGGDVVVSDTVGFIRRLPERLLASFESTLAEVVEASLLLMVVDMSDPEVAAHLETTSNMLDRLGAHAVPRLVVFNKCDKLAHQPTGLAHLAQGTPYIAVSSRDTDCVASLRQQILACAHDSQVERQVFVPYQHGGLLKPIYAHCRVLSSEALEGGTRFMLQGPANHIETLIAQLEELQA